jgi:glycosyltransferase involved in cell wall biosynthesis
MKLVAITIPLQLNKSVTIGVSAYGNLDNTRMCLQSILQSVQGEYELILVDDCSPDNGDITKLYLEIAKLHANTHVFCFTKNHEYSGSLNCILSHATGDYVIFISNDIYVTPYYLDALLAVAASKETVGIVRGVSNFVDNDKATHNIVSDTKITNLNEVMAFSKKIYDKNTYNFFIEFYLVYCFACRRTLLTAGVL